MFNGWNIFSLYLAGSALLVVLGVPLQRSWVPPNRWFGFRTPRTLSDPKIWYPVNRVTGFWLIVTGLAIAVTATIAHFWELDIIHAAVINGIIYIVGLVVMTIHSLICLKKHCEK